jgi:hypothetical protein
VTSTTERPGNRLYGGWRRSRSVGLGSLDSRQTVMVVVAALAPIGTAAVRGLVDAAVVSVPALVVASLAVARRDGGLVLDLVVARLRWQIASWRGQTLYRGQVFTSHPRALDLPGVLAPTKLLQAREPGRSDVGIVWNQATGLMSATVLLSPAGALLADAETVDRQVASWGQLLSGLADNPLIHHAAVTIELVPEPGTQLADHVHGRIDAEAPQLARDVLTQIVAAAPKGASCVAARLTLTLDPLRGTRTRGVAEAVAEVMRAIGGLPVASAGADVLRRATGTDLIRIVRTAFDPDTAVIPSAEFDQLTWADTGPVTVSDEFDHLVHDGAYSVSWVLLEAPRQKVPHSVLLPLLSPGQHRRRVTLCFRTLSREEAGLVLDREVNAAAAREEYRRRTKRDPTARDRADAERAARSAAEEAHGAGLVQFSMYVTATVTDPAYLVEARREVEQAAGLSRLRLRLARGGQAALFAVGLPCGIYPPAI